MARYNPLYVCFWIVERMHYSNCFLFFPRLFHFSDRFPRTTAVVYCCSCLFVDFYFFFFFFAHLRSCFDFWFPRCLAELYVMVTVDFHLLIQLLLGLDVQYWPQCTWPSLHVSGSIRCSGSGKVLHVETKQGCLPLRSSRQFCRDRFWFLCRCGNLASSIKYRFEAVKNSSRNCKCNVAKSCRFKSAFNLG